DDVIMVSAKEGIGIAEVLEAVVQRIPAPAGRDSEPARALIFDSHYDAYKGVVAYVRMVDGTIPRGARGRFLGTAGEVDTLGVGAFHRRMVPLERLDVGEVGYIATGLKSMSECQVGDTITLAERPAAEPLPGYRPAKPVVFAGLYPLDSVDYPHLRDALEK